MREWALDVSLGIGPVWVPIEFHSDGSFTAITGMNLIADMPPGKAVAIIHEEGQAAVEAWMETEEAKPWLERMSGQ